MCSHFTDFAVLRPAAGDTSSSGSSLATGAIIGIVVGAGALVLLMVIVVVRARRNKSSKGAPQPELRGLTTSSSANGGETGETGEGVELARGGQRV
jgi:hypothetical protein